MSVMNLGLEALAIQKETDTENMVSYEYLDAVIDYSAASDELNIIFDQFDSIFRAVQNLEAVYEVIAAEGVTPALESLIGGNFKDGLSLETIEASMEGVMANIWDAIVRAWNAIVAWFKKLFGFNKGAKTRLDQWLKDAAKAEKLNNPKEFDKLSAETLKDIKQYVDAIPTKIEKGTGDAAKFQAAYSEKGGKAEATFVKHTFSEDGLAAAIQYAELLKDAVDALDNNAQKINNACSTMLKRLDAAIKDAKNPKKNKPEERLFANPTKGKAGDSGADMVVGTKQVDTKQYDEYKNCTEEIRKIINGYVKPLNRAVSSFLGANKLIAKKKDKKD